MTTVNATAGKGGGTHTRKEQKQGERSRDVAVKSGAEEGRGRVTRHSPLTRQAPLSFFESPFAVMRQLSDEMSRVFEGVGLGREIGRDTIASATWAPRIDVLRRDADLVVRADLPGMSRDDVNVDITDNVLTISGERREESENEREGMYWCERSYGSFRRSIPLPDNADGQAAKARFENGVLEVMIPAPERETQRSHRVDIS